MFYLLEFIDFVVQGLDLVFSAAGPFINYPMFDHPSMFYYSIINHPMFDHPSMFYYSIINYPMFYHSIIDQACMLMVDVFI